MNQSIQFSGFPPSPLPPPLLPPAGKGSSGDYKNPPAKISSSPFREGKKAGTNISLLCLWVEHAIIHQYIQRESGRGPKNLLTTACKFKFQEWPWVDGSRA